MLNSGHQSVDGFGRGRLDVVAGLAFHAVMNGTMAARAKKDTGHAGVLDTGTTFGPVKDAPRHNVRSKEAFLGADVAHRGGLVSGGSQGFPFRAGDPALDM
ncbi:hypothetical protein [Arthrobacter alpinus]|uniref:hypothetical protein n=1 Tax=Arthrobacter alpinus TaxID=656366 RepID=UPI000AA9A72E|nr:hypothetical protein [Arthrobacter alpinus]